jgi:UDP-3-O-[3-hydroxymyristoyl] glucosamine N-acyltransferase
MKLGDLIERLGGELVGGSADMDLVGVASTEVADSSHLVFAENDAQVVAALASKAAAIVLREVGDSIAANKALIQTKNPRLWFAQAAQLIRASSAPALPVVPQVHPSAIVGEVVELASGVSIGAGVVLGDGVSIGSGSFIEAGAVIGAGVQIGEGCRIFPHVTLYAGTTIGNRVVLHSGVVLGADGFGYVRDSASGAYTQFPQQGTLVIEDDVEIGANSTIDRGALGETRIGRGTKIDNLVHIGHNCQIGEDVIIVALTGISGSCTVGRGAVIAGQVGLGDHAHVGEGVILGGQAGVLSGKTLTNDGYKPGTVFWGTPAKPLQQHLRELATLARLAKRTTSKK